MSKPVQFYSRFVGRRLILMNKDGSESTYVFPGHFATMLGSGVKGVTREDHIEQLKQASKRLSGLWEMTEEELNPSVVPDASSKETKVKLDDGSYRVISDDQLKAMVQLADEANSGIEQDEPTVPGGAELKARRKETGLSLKQASEKFEVSVATISRWENLGELAGKSLLMYEGLKEVTA